MNNNPPDPVEARGIALGILICLLLVWIPIALWLFGTSVMAELGRRAVEQGVIP